MQSDTQKPPLAFARHNHGLCESAGISSAQQKCHDNGLRLTKTRTRVLEILLESHKALGAYDILERLKHEGLGSQPPIVYRALDFLTENGFVHRLERLNAFTACAFPEQSHEAVFLICQACQNVAETPQINMCDAIDHAASDLGFKVTSKIVEIAGLCPACQPQDAP